MPNKINQQEGVKVPENKGLLTEIIIATIKRACRVETESLNDEFGFDLVSIRRLLWSEEHLTSEILAKIREVVEGAGLTDEEINPYWQIWNKEHYEEVHNAGNENRTPILIRDDTVFIETENSRVYKKGMEAQLQSILKAIDKGDK